MAICTFGTIITAARGAIGGSIFSANKSGPYVRNFARSPNANTALQQRTRSFVAVTGASWTALSSAQKTGWNALSSAPPETVYNSLGKVTVLSGYQWYAKITCRQRSIGAAVSTTAPAGSAPAAVASLDGTIAQGSSNVLFTTGYFGANEYLVLLMTFRTAGGALVASRQYHLTSIDLTPPASQHFFQADIDATFGVPVTGWRCFILFYKQLLNGLRSPAKSLARTVITFP